MSLTFFPAVLPANPLASASFSHSIVKMPTLSLGHLNVWPAQPTWTRTTPQQPSLKPQATLLCFSMSNIQKKGREKLPSCSSPAHRASRAGALSLVNHYVLIADTPPPPVMKCIWMRATCSKSMHVWHNRSPDALLLITLSNLVWMCCCSSDMI